MQDFGSATLNNVCIVTMSRVPRCLRRSHLLPRMNALPLPSAFSSALDSEISLMNFLWEIVGITLETLFPSRRKCSSNLTVLACGSKQPLMWYVIRDFSVVSLMRAQPDRYNVCVFHDTLKINFARYQYLHEDDGHFLVTFSSHKTNARPPDRRLLTLHAVCARVAHLSGATQAIVDEEGIVDELE